MTRISKLEYDKIYDESDGFSCVFTENHKKFTRHFITALFEG